MPGAKDLPIAGAGMVHAFADETMGRRLRFFQAEQCYFVTARCLQARLLLRPSPVANALLEGILARAARLHSVQLFGFVFASNHVHLLLRAPQGNLAGFMQFLLGNVARKIGRTHNWSGRLWERRYAAAPVLDSEALVDKLGYILAHGAKEGLVRRCAEWPGVSSLGQLLGKAVRSVHWFNWSQRARKGTDGRQGDNLVDPRFAEPEQLEVHPLPAWGHLSPPERVRRIRELVKAIERDAAKAHPTPLGVAAVLAQPPDTRPLRPKRGPAPLCHTSDPSLRTAFRDLYVNFVQRVREAAARFRKGELTVRIPHYEIRPFLWPSAATVA